MDDTAIRALSQTLDGEVITPEDAHYDETRALFNAMIDRRPAAIACCVSVDDVVACVGAARSKETPLAVRGGGHSVAGVSLCDDGLVIDVRRMNEVTVDPQARTARTGAGATWGEFDAATQAHGLATTGGRVSTTGVTGLTLGGGSGWLERSYGLACDNLVAVELVTAAGERVRASADEHQELFWALRGGGGNFGVVTALEYRLHEVGPTVFGGLAASIRGTGGRSSRRCATSTEAADPTRPASPAGISPRRRRSSSRSSGTGSWSRSPPGCGTVRSRRASERSRRCEQ